MPDLFFFFFFSAPSGHFCSSSVQEIFLNSIIFFSKVQRILKLILLDEVYLDI